MLRFNDKLFAPLGGQVSADCIGFFKTNADRGVHLYQLNGELEAYMVSNPQQGHFIVSASMQYDVPRYMHSTCSLTETWLGIENMGLTQEHDAVRERRLENINYGVLLE